MNTSSTELIVSLDLDNVQEVKTLITSLGESVTWYKVGKQMFTHYGPSIVALLKLEGKKVFLDLKFHDIPNTVAKAVGSAVDIGSDMINMHASGGSEMLAAGLETARNLNPEVLVIGVTVLTSMDESSFGESGYRGNISEQVVRLAALARNNGLDGVVASAHEIQLIKDSCGTDFIQVIPGIRPSGCQSQDQKRVMTPAEASARGAGFIVVGRPITQAADPLKVTQAILRELRS
jgi:orotidine-5'-phosphate decarboxylase